MTRDRIGPVLTFGEPLISFVHQGTESLSVDRKFHIGAAGAELNTAIGLARLGFPVAYAAVVGDDPLGEFIIREARAEGVDVSLVARNAKYPTGTLVKIMKGLSQNPDVFYYRSLSALGNGQWDTDSVHTALQSTAFAWMHSTGITWMLADATRERAQTLLRVAHERSMPTSFDVNIRKKLGGIEAWRQMLRDVVPYVTWLFMGDSEAIDLFGSDDAHTLFASLHEWGFAGEGLVVKRGEKGASAIVGSEVTHVDALQVPQVVDSVGAGDGFNAGWLAGRLLGWDLEQSLKLGAIVGAFAVTSIGDSSGYPTFAQALTHLTGAEEVTR
jgi:2-dehydro-3-deoxygluconokinase